MFFKLLLFKNRVNKFTQKFYKESQWVITLESLLELVSLLDEELLTFYSPHIGNQIKLQVVHKNVHNLIELLTEANSVVSYLSDIPNVIQKPRNNETVITIRLDDYLVTKTNQPIKPQELCHVFTQVIPKLGTNLLTLKEKSQFKYDYYIRQFTYLIEETFFVLLSLVEVSKHARKQRSGKTAYFSH